MAKLEIVLDEDELRWLSEQGGEPTAVIHGLVRRAREEQDLRRLLRERLDSLDRGEGVEAEDAFWEEMDRAIEDAARRSQRPEQDSDPLSLEEGES